MSAPYDPLAVTHAVIRRDRAIPEAARIDLALAPNGGGVALTSTRLCTGGVLELCLEPHQAAKLANALLEAALRLSREAGR